MKRLLCCMLALVMVIGMPVSAFAAEAEDETPAPEDQVPGTESETKSAGTVTLMYLDPSQFVVSEEQRVFTNATDEDKLVSIDEPAQLNEGGELQAIPEAPEITGWTFAGWYTAPVAYAFWGDTPETDYSNYEDIPFEYDCDGKPYEDELVYTGKTDIEGEGQWTQRLEKYWIWLSTLGDGTNPEAGKKVDVGDSIPEDVTVLYARYKPTAIEYKLYFQGWNKTNGALICGRQYGTPFGHFERGGWDGYIFEGWFTDPTGGEKINDFYFTPKGGESYYAHWRSNDGLVTHANYKTNGYKPVTGLSLRDDDIGKGQKELGDTIQLPDGKGFKNIVVWVDPSDCGVTDLEWVLEDANGDTVSSDNADGPFGNSIVTVTPRHTYQESDKWNDTWDKLSVRIDATGTKGKTTLTVKTKDGKNLFDSVVIDTTGHQFDKVEVIKWGNCADPKILLYTCVICGETEQQKSYASHVWAWRDIPGTCTTDHVWEHYCKVCGAVDPDESTRYWEQGKAPGHQFQTTKTIGCGGTVTTQTCTVCGYTESSIDGVGVHNWSITPTVDVRPTCHSDGSQSVKCSDCGAVQPNSSQTIPQDTSLHTWDSWTVNRAATETEPGEQTRKCSSCGAEETRAIPPTGLKDDVYDIADVVETYVLSDEDEVADQSQATETIQKTIKEMLGSENRNMLADDIFFASLQSKDISATIQVTPVAAPENDDDFSSLLGSDAAVAYMDIDILVKVGGQNLGKITQTSGAITFKAALPGEGDSVKVLRAHEGVVEEIPCQVENGSVYFSTDKFSTFAVIVSNTENSNAPSGDSGSTPGGDSGSTPGGDSGSIPGGDSGSTPGGDSGGDSDSNPGGDSDNGSGSVPSDGSGEDEQIHVCPSEKFTDVDANAGYHEGVDFAIENGLMEGTGATTFAPNATTTRAMVVTILYRLEGEPAVTEDVKFSDVPAGQWYSDAINWAAANGVVDGYGNGKFGPGDTITREQMAAILYRYATLKGYDVSAMANLTGYTDADSISSWATNAMRWAVSEGLIEGTSATTLAPTGNSTRAQAAAILMRFCEDVVK